MQTHIGLLYKHTHKCVVLLCIKYCSNFMVCKRLFISLILSLSLCIFLTRSHLRALFILYSYCHNKYLYPSSPKNFHLACSLNLSLSLSLSLTLVYSFRKSLIQVLQSICAVHLIRFQHFMPLHRHSLHGFFSILFFFILPSLYYLRLYFNIRVGFTYAPFH